MKLFRFVLFYIIIVSLFMALLISGLVYINIDNTISKSNQQNVEREIAAIKYEYQSFFKVNLNLLEDYAKNPLFTQAVMQPEINRFIITDVIKNIRFFKEQYDMYVLDFEGNIINIVNNPNIQFLNEPWVEQLIDGKINSQQSLINMQQNYYWQLAVPIVYNNNNEGVLVIHIPTQRFATFSDIQSRLVGMSISLLDDTRLIEFLGEKIKGNKYIVALNNNMGQLEFVIDSTLVDEEILALSKKLIFIILVTGLLTILVSLYFTKKIVIQPLHELQEGLLNFFDFVNRKTKDVKTLSISGANEIGDMATVINENILKTKKLIEQERETIADIAKTVEQFSLCSLDNNSLKKDEVTHNELLLILNTLNNHSQELGQLNLRLQEEIAQAVEESSKKDRLLAEQSKLAAMGEMIGSIAHQWRQPLNTLALKVQFMEDDFEDGLIDLKYLEAYSNESMKLINFMSKTIDDFRDFFKSDKEKVTISIQSLIQKPLDIIQLQLNNHNINLAVSGDDFKVDVIENELQQVILNIINNAKDSIVEQQVQTGKIEVQTIKNAHVGVIVISDNGGGIPDEIMDRIFEPYYTTKEQGKGTGIGLYMSKMIIVDHLNGSLESYNEENRACFKITLPLAKED